MLQFALIINASSTTDFPCKRTAVAIHLAYIDQFEEVVLCNSIHLQFRYHRLQVGRMIRYNLCQFSLISAVTVKSSLDTMDI